ncbi:DUF1045 domain-containing protein [Oceanibacterium hippocampi]|uniref:2',5' RNA ligase family n=1 Tax=Oceanibacterium hippocampi TaxID=745714 RepID=A0A1Y5TXF1_9PROT|nr:DUF1045 domain-containing protein [Oceanibacterium hippocampi]SLN76119.1 2',5' RNA ligase family [Oceanibacterium hippocampi]
MTVPRYAIYFTPDPASPLWLTGCRWLGRDPVSGALFEAPSGIDPDCWRRVTAAAAGYGFHATLKPPFHLAGGRTLPDLVDRMRVFASPRPAFEAPPLVVADLAAFLALVPTVLSRPLGRLAGDCVAHFDDFRAPPSDRELAKRRAAGLSARQEALLGRWGYPYVFEEFRFHMTLTSRLDADLRARLLAHLEARFADVTAEPLGVDGIALFEQPAPGAPFRQIERFPFTG